MTKPTCSIPECERTHHCAGYCKMHYTRWKRHGDPLTKLHKASKPGTKGACSVEGCDKDQQARGWCPMHYQRWRQFGSLASPAPPVLERFLDKVRKTDTCWIWEASTDSKGYGQMRLTVDGIDRLHQAHRISYELFKTPIPEGLHVDHICHVTACVNPEHLRTVTVKQNLEHRVGAARHSKTGVRGVSIDSKTGRYRATVNHNGRQAFGGNYSSLHEAEAAVIALRNQLFTHNDADRAA